MNKNTHKTFFRNKNPLNMRLSLLEIFLLELAVWLGLWLLNDYIATLLTLILVAIVFAILLIALMAEGIERSKVPRKYFQVMIISALTPLLAGAIYMTIFGGDLHFLKQ
jgi:hypothetical protein